MKIVKKYSGLVFDDQFTSLSNWDITSPQNVSLGNGLVVTHNESRDVRVLRTLPKNANIIELAIDYTPVAESDLAGVMLYASDTNIIEVVEGLDDEQSHVTDFKIIRKDGEFNIYALRDSQYEFVASSSEPFTKIGFVVKKGLSTYTPLKALQVQGGRNNFLTFSGLPPGAYGEFTSNAITVTETAVDGIIQHELAHVEQTIAVKLLTEDGSEIYANEQLYSAGDEYYCASELIVLKDGIPLSVDKDNEIGSLTGNIVERKLEIHNPLAFAINNITVQIAEYFGKQGYIYADVALDNDGAQGAYSDTLVIPTLESNSSVFFWFKFDKTNDTEGWYALGSFVDISHD